MRRLKIGALLAAGGKRERRPLDRKPPAWATFRDWCDRVNLCDREWPLGLADTDCSSTIPAVLDGYGTGGDGTLYRSAGEFGKGPAVALLPAGLPLSVAKGAESAARPSRC